ncbi:keratin, type I cytoskeletal 9-like [Numida meleagris]|uniref:keratin, type I cytoskeletal 9-like n=1 Tax=Numida meleagris TaxID=8996 RepID=UPI000B3E2275|nr:keratin, type I cytoskeletal 9-like [Numida meleagris]
MKQKKGVLFFLFQIFQFLRGRCSRQNRGYSNGISSHYGGTPSLQGRGSFFCSGEGSIIYSRGAVPTSSPYSTTGESMPGSDGVVVVPGGDSEGASGWSTTGGTVPTYRPRGAAGYGTEDTGWSMAGGSGGGGGAGCYSGRLGVGTGRGSSYGYDASQRQKAVTTSAGQGLYGGASGYGTSGELSSGGAGTAQITQQKCPVVVPDIEPQQIKQSCQWLPSQKK